LYAGAEFRRGDIVSTMDAAHAAEYGHAARGEAIDAAFGPGYRALRLGGTTRIVTVGWNLPLGPKQALDLAWRNVRSSAALPAESGGVSETLHYHSALASLSWLLRF
jgi:hypothetical protein